MLSEELYQTLDSELTPYFTFTKNGRTMSAQSIHKYLATKGIVKFYGTKGDFGIVCDKFYKTEYFSKYEQVMTYLRMKLLKEKGKIINEPK